MKRKLALCAAVLCLTMALSPSAFAAESVVISQSSAPPEICYPTSVSRSEDGTEIRKYYDLGPEEDPAGIPRSDFEQDGFRYTLIDLLKQELPENESRQHTETVSLESKSKPWPRVPVTSRKPLFGAEILRWRRTTGAPTTILGRSIPWSWGMRSP